MKPKKNWKPRKELYSTEGNDKIFPSESSQTRLTVNTSENAINSNNNNNVIIL